MEVELFTIRCGINQAIQMQKVSHIIVITDIIHVENFFFDPSIHLYYQQLIVISNELRVFFSKHEDNTIAFWNCSNDEWISHKAVDKETKCFNLIPLHPSKESWDFSKKRACDDLIEE